jgi:hypothetical protein
MGYAIILPKQSHILRRYHLRMLYAPARSFLPFRAAAYTFKHYPVSRVANGMGTHLETFFGCIFATSSKCFWLLSKKPFQFF